MDRFSGYPILVSSWSETQDRQVATEKLMQGDIGTRAMGIGGYKWVTSVSSPVLLVRADGTAGYNSQYNNGTLTILDTIVNNLNIYRNPIAFQNFVIAYNSAYANQLYGFYVMKSGSIAVTSEGGKCSATLHSDYFNVFQKSFCDAQGSVVTPRFIGRSAKWYDTFMRIAWANMNDALISEKLSDFGAPRSMYQVQSGRIQIDIDVSEHFFVGQRNDYIVNSSYYWSNGVSPSLYPKGNIPMFSIKGYTVTGDFKVLVEPDDPILQINPEVPNCFSPRQGVIGLSIGNIDINFGEAMVQSSVSKSMSPGELVTVDAKFQVYANSTSLFALSGLDLMPCQDPLNPLSP